MSFADRPRRAPATSLLADIAWRGAGVVALGGAALSSLAHRAVLAGHPAGPPSAWEAFFGLLSFIAASLGILLLLHGRQLVRRDRVARRRPD